MCEIYLQENIYYINIFIKELIECFYSLIFMKLSRNIEIATAN